MRKGRGWILDSEGLGSREIEIGIEIGIGIGIEIEMGD